MAINPQPTPGGTPPASRTAQLAAYLEARPGQWIDGRILARVAGAYAWRTRVSELRRAPYLLTVENRQRTIRTVDGGRYVASEYRLVRDGGEQ
jgi:hypothetical protein